MLRSTATVVTARPDRYRDQLARHGAGMLRQVRRGTEAGMPLICGATTTGEALVLDLAWGRCTVTATDEKLVLEAEAATHEDLERIQDGVGRRLTQIGRRDGLAVTWSATAGEPHEAGATDVAAGRRTHGWGIVVLVALVAVVIHLGLGAVLLRQTWTWWALTGLGAVVALKLFVARHLASALRMHGFGRPGRR